MSLDSSKQLPVKGLIHLAAVLDDATLPKLTRRRSTPGGEGETGRVGLMLCPTRIWDKYKVEKCFLSRLDHQIRSLDRLLAHS